MLSPGLFQLASESESDYLFSCSLLVAIFPLKAKLPSVVWNLQVPTAKDRFKMLFWLLTKKTFELSNSGENEVKQVKYDTKLGCKLSLKLGSFPSSHPLPSFSRPALVWMANDFLWQHFPFQWCGWTLLAVAAWKKSAFPNVLLKCQHLWARLSPRPFWQDSSYFIFRRLIQGWWGRDGVSSIYK